MQTNDPPATPKDATKATDEQRDMQDKLEHRNDDPEAPVGIRRRTRSPTRPSPKSSPAVCGEELPTGIRGVKPVVAATVDLYE
jgi:hypothetical protein